jgi:hypothetical protein
MLPLQSLVLAFSASGMRSGTLLQRHPDVATSDPNSLNCTWKYITQPLDHFDVSGSSDLHYQERYCIYDKYWGTGRSAGFNTVDPAERGPIFFYTGNESPVEEYINNTGLMWQLGPCGTIFFSRPPFCLLSQTNHRCPPSCTFKEGGAFLMAHVPLHL